MPLYRYKCSECGEFAEELRSMRERNDPCICSCDKEMDRDFTLGTHRGGGEHERISTALGVHVSQIESGEVYKVHPGARFTPDGYMILKNRGEQKRRLRERGWRNYDSYGNY